jgi:hypothetical protein
VNAFSQLAVVINRGASIHDATRRQRRSGVDGSLREHNSPGSELSKSAYDSARMHNGGNRCSRLAEIPQKLQSDACLPDGNNDRPKTRGNFHRFCTGRHHRNTK